MNQPFGSIAIHFERPFYSSGQQVNAIINLNLLQDFPGNTIFMYILGVEEVKLVQTKRVDRMDYFTLYAGGRQPYFQFYEYSKYRDAVGIVPTVNAWDVDRYLEDNNGRIKVVLDHYKYKNIVNNRFQVYQGPNQTFSRGQYSFPISFQLPTGLPASFDMNWKQEGRLCFGNISYKIQVSLESANSNVMPIQAHQEFAVNQTVQGLNQNLRIHDNRVVKSCCCINKGPVQITSYFEKGEYRGGDTAFIVTEVDNALGKATIKDLKAEFVQEVLLRTDDFKQTVTNVLNSHTIAGMMPGETKVGNNAQRIQVQLTDKNGPIQPTSKGQLITNKYSLVTKAEMDACICCDEHPNAKAEVNILSRGTEVGGAGMPGVGGWNPTVMTQFNASLVGGGGTEGVGGNNGGNGSDGYAKPPDGMNMNATIAKGPNTDYPSL